MRSEEEIREQIQDLVMKMNDPPEDVEADELDKWIWYCKGGISFAYWTLKEKNVVLSGRKLCPNCGIVLELQPREEWYSINYDYYRCPRCNFQRLLKRDEKQ